VSFEDERDEHRAQRETHVVDLGDAFAARLKRGAMAALLESTTPEDWLMLDRLAPLLKSAVLREAAGVVLRRWKRKTGRGA
jgi:hypothetical protein